MIRLEAISIRLPGFALENIDLSIATGTYAVLMGRTGCGKTTLIEAVCGLKPIDQGRVHLMNRDVTRWPPGRRGIGFVPQEAALFNTMSVAENLGFALALKRWPAARIRARVGELAERLAIAHLLKRRPQGLSGGERQRVALGRALAARPDVLCLDEPFSALDEETHDGMVRLLRSVHRDLNVTVLHITHNRHEARRLAQLTLRLRHGRVEAETACAQPSAVAAAGRDG